jgi:hypothetical protein
MFYLYRLSINPTQGAERRPKRREMAFCLWIILCTAHQNANASRLLPVRGERPCRQNRNSCNELAPSHWLTQASSPGIVAGQTGILEVIGWSSLSALGHERTLRHHRSMSVILPKADIRTG